MNRPIKVMLIDDDPGIHESLRAVSAPTCCFSM